jgi:hypothetical protein
MDIPEHSSTKNDVDILTLAQLRTISCLLESNSIEDAAQNAGVSRGTIYNWLKDPSFKKRLRSERDTLFAESLDLLRQASGTAVRTLVKLLESHDESTRRLAAKDLLTIALKATELISFEDRLSNVEAIVERKSNIP